MYCTWGEIPERSKGTDCKSVGSAFEGSNPSLATIIIEIYAVAIQIKKWYVAGIAQLARATAFQAVGCGFESRFPLQKIEMKAGVAQW